MSDQQTTDVDPVSAEYDAAYDALTSASESTAMPGEATTLARAQVHATLMVAEAIAEAGAAIAGALQARAAQPVPIPDVPSAAELADAYERAMATKTAGGGGES